MLTRTRWLLVVAAVIALTALAGATFPGANGQITYAQFNPAIGDFQIWVANPDGSSPLQLTSLPSAISNWSADGSKIVFDFFDGQNVQIATINPNGTGFKQLTTNDAVFSGEPAWSPDGSQIVIESDAGNFPAGEGLYIINAKTGVVVRRLTSNSLGGQDFFAQWSPDGQWIAFTRTKQATNLQLGGGQSAIVSAIFLVQPDGTGLRQLTQWGLFAKNPDWSPDGSTIVFNTESYPPAPSSILTIRPDGSGMTTIAKANDGQVFAYPRYSPDGTKIILSVRPNKSSPFSQWIMNADGSGLAQITSIPARTRFADWGTHPLQ